MKKVINTFFSLILLLLGGFLLVILTSFNRDKTDNNSKDFLFGGLFIDSVKADAPSGGSGSGSGESDSCEAAGAGDGTGSSGGTEGCSAP